MPLKINKILLKENINSALLKNDKIYKEAKIVAQEIMTDNLNRYISELENHPVSQEISEGSNANNTSRTLDGEGNLFSFIGFESNDRPIERLKNIVKSNTFIKFKNSKNSIFNFSVFTPSPTEVYSETPMPFEGGRSWIKGIEKGISGFSNYLYGLIFPQSRSGRAIQTENKIRKSNFKPTAYFTKLYNDFLGNFKQ